MGQIYTLNRPQMSSKKAAQKQQESGKVGVEHEASLEQLSDADMNLLMQCQEFFGHKTMGETLEKLSGIHMDEISRSIKRGYRLRLVKGLK